MRTSAALLIFTIATAGPAAAQTAATPVLTIVRVAKPSHVPRTLVAGKMRETVAQYADLPGLAFKAYSFERDSGDFGGIYLWTGREAAQAWFNPAWFERVQSERGVEGRVRSFEAPVSLDNVPGGVPASKHSAAVATLVEVPIPAGVTRERLLAGFRAAVPEYQRVSGLLRKHFTFNDTHFGGVYLWADEAAARAWLNEAWFARVLQTYGAGARIEWFDTPILLPTQNAAHRVAAGAMIEAAP